MTHSTPTVLVPARLSDGAADVRIDSANQLFHGVVALVRAAGLEPVITDDPDIDLSSFSGVVLPGGGDVDPTRYGGQQIAALYDVNPAQDELDFRIAERALDRGLPILGICRGLQVLNTVYGGTLYEDLAPSSVVHTDPDAAADEWMWHPVMVTAGSALEAASGGSELVVASGHHQGIRRVGSGLTVVATAADGLVEGVEDSDRRVLAVQWHPEAEGCDDDVRHGPFRAFSTAMASL